jgi:hypothetical protein
LIKKPYQTKTQKSEADKSVEVHMLMNIDIDRETITNKSASNGSNLVIFYWNMCGELFKSIKMFFPA